MLVTSSTATVPRRTGTAPRPLVTRVGLGVLAAALLAPGLVPPAAAEPPLALEERVTDSAGVLDAAAAEEAVAELDAETGVDLFVVFVDDFGGLGFQEWFQETSRLSNLGGNDALLAVAVEERAFDFDVGEGTGVDPGERSQIIGTAIEPELGDGDWTGAVVAAADGIAEAAQTGAADGGVAEQPAADLEAAPAGGGAGLFFVVLAVLGFMVILGMLAIANRKKPALPAHEVARRRGEQGNATLPLPELRTRASQALLATDDAVRESSQELEFARAEFGDAAVSEFTSALATARASLQEAFAAQSRLEGAGEPLPEHEQRELLQVVLDRSEHADETLEAQAEAMDRLRDLESSLPTLLPQLVQRHEQATAALPAGREGLGRLQRTYSGAAVAPVEDAVDNAEDLLSFAGERLHAAEQRMQASLTGEAAVLAREAEVAVSQAEEQLRDISALERDMADAQRELPAALADLRSDVAEARGLLGRGGTDALAGSVGRAEQAAAEAEAQLGRSGGDPLGVLRRVEKADAAVEEALRASSEQGKAVARATAALEHTLVAARADVQGVERYIDSHRGAVGTQARTLAGNARRALDHAEEVRDSDPVLALQAAQYADAQADQARAQAESDAGRYRDPHDDYRGPYGGRGGVDLGTIAAGVLLGQVLGGGGRRGRSGGLGGGGFGGSFGGGGFGGGGFGAASAGAVSEVEEAAGASEVRAPRPGVVPPRSTTGSSQQEEPMAQQSIFGRISQMTRANIHALIDNAEDPQKMLDQMIRDFTASISEAEQAVAQTIGNLRMMEADRDEDAAAAKDWGNKAIAASTRADQLRGQGNDAEADRLDNLAKIAIERQIKAEQDASALSGQVASQQEVVEKLRSGLENMKGKLGELKSRRDELVSRQRVAVAQNQMHDSIKSINLADPTSELTRFEEKIRREEARAMGNAELAASSLDSQFAQLEDAGTSIEVESRLAALKAAREAR